MIDQSLHNNIDNFASLVIFMAYVYRTQGQRKCCVHTGIRIHVQLYLTSVQLSSCLRAVTCACPAYRKYVGVFSLGRDNEKGCVFTSYNRVDKELHFDVFMKSYLQIHSPLVTPHQFKKTHTLPSS